MNQTSKINWPAIPYSFLASPEEKSRRAEFLSGGFSFSSIWSRIRLRQVAERFGKNIRTSGPLKIIAKGRLLLEDEVMLVSDYQRLRLVVGSEGLLEIGKGTVINSSIIAAQQHIHIGANCRLAPFVHLMDSDFHDIRDRLAEGKTAPIHIGDNARLGAYTLVLRGVTIGAGAEILPGSVVTKDIPAGALAGGVPARVLDEN